MNSISKTTIEINGKTFTVSFPTINQFMLIEAKKMQFSSGLYPQMLNTGVKTVDHNLDLIDTICYFSVLIPDFQKELNVDDFGNMSLLQMKPIVEAYKKQFWPWFLPLFNEVTQLPESTKGEKTA